MKNNAKRQKTLRQRKKELGIKEVKIDLTPEDQELVLQCYLKAFDPGNSYKEFLHKSLVRGVVFVANSGAGKRIKKEQGRYAVTQEKADG